MPRKFLVVVDDSPEFDAALRYAARRARSTGGRVALLAVIPDSSDEHWAGVREEIQRQQRAEAEALLAQIRKEKAEAEAQAAEMMAQAEADARRLEVETKAKLEETLARRQKMAETRIAQAEAQASAEVKAAAAVSAADFTGLRRLAALAGRNFRSGVLLYDGVETLPMGADCWAVPLATLWTT